MVYIADRGSAAEKVHAAGEDYVAQKDDAANASRIPASTIRDYHRPAIISVILALNSPQGKAGPGSILR